MDAWVHMHLNVVACIYNANDSIPLAVPGSRAAGGDGVVGSEPLPLAVPGSRAADAEGTALPSALRCAFWSVFCSGGLSHATAAL